MSSFLPDPPSRTICCACIGKVDVDFDQTRWLNVIGHSSIEKNTWGTTSKFAISFDQPVISDCILLWLFIIAIEVESEKFVDATIVDCCK